MHEQPENVCQTVALAAGLDAHSTSLCRYRRSKHGELLESAYCSHSTLGPEINPPHVCQAFIDLIASTGQAHKDALQPEGKPNLKIHERGKAFNNRSYHKPWLLKGEIRECYMTHDK